MRRRRCCTAHERLADTAQEAADAAARLGRTPDPRAAIKRGRQRRRRLIGGTASLLVLVLLAGTVSRDWLTSRQLPLAPASTTPTTSTSSPSTSTSRVPAAVGKAIPLDVQVHAGLSGVPDRFGMVSDVLGVMEDCEGGRAEIRAWAQVLGETWLLAAKQPLPGKNWICWSDGLFDRQGGSLFGSHGGSSNKLKLLQASQLSNVIGGKGELAAVGGPVTRDAVRLRILFRSGVRSMLCRSTPAPNSQSGSTPRSTFSQQRQRGNPNAWSLTTRPASGSRNAGPRQVKATPVTVPREPLNRHDDLCP